MDSNKKKLFNEKQILYYHKHKKQLIYYYANREKISTSMKNYRLNNKIEKKDVTVPEKVLKFQINYGKYVINFD